MKTPPDSTRCRQFLEQLSMYLDGELSAEDRGVVSRHLHDCPCCDEVLHSLQQTVALCHEEGRPELPADIEARARARVADLLKTVGKKKGPSPEPGTNRPPTVDAPPGRRAQSKKQTLS